MKKKFQENELEDILYTSKKDLFSVIKNTVKDLVKEHPLICLGFTFAFGIALGSMLTEAKKE